MARPADRARAYVRTEHDSLVAAIEDRADALAASDGSLTDGREVAAALEAALARDGLLAALVPVLEGALDAAGLAPTASPVAAPPYVVVTSRGPLLRASTADGRLVVTIRVFEPRRGDGLAYARPPAEAATVLASLEAE